MRMNLIAPVDVMNIRNSRGQTLLDLATDRGKHQSAEFLRHLQSVQGNISVVEASRQHGAVREERQNRPELPPAEAATPGRQSFAGCVCSNRPELLSLVKRFLVSPLSKPQRGKSRVRACACACACACVCARACASQLQEYFFAKPTAKSPGLTAKSPGLNSRRRQAQHGRQSTAFDNYGRCAIEAGVAQLVKLVLNISAFDTARPDHITIEQSHRLTVEVASDSRQSSPTLATCHRRESERAALPCCASGQKAQVEV
jgi:ankyrin repeat protein